MKTLLRFVLLLAMYCAAVFAQIPKTLSYQGVLSDSLGAPKPDGTYSITFRLYDIASGGTALWTELKTLNVKRGLFSTTLGDQVVFGQNLLFDKPYWLSIQVATGAELTPRIPLSSVGYSLNSIKADSSRIAGNVRELSISSLSILDGAIGMSKIADGAVTQGKIAAGVTLPPGGTAGGDLSLSYPNPTVVKIQNRTVANTAPTDGYVLKWNASATQWAPAADATGGSGTITGGGTTGQVSFWNGLTSLAGNNSLSWDNTNNRLSLGTPVTGAPLNFSNVVGDKIAFLGPTGSHYGIGVQNQLLQIYSSDHLVFGSGSFTFTERMRIASSGNIGIGVNDPKTILHVKGSPSYGAVRVSPAADNGASEIGLFSDAAGTTTNTAWILSNGGWANTGKFVIGNENGGGIGSGNVRLTIEKNGRVGIGTTFPRGLLHVAGDPSPSPGGSGDSLFFFAGGGNNGGSLIFQAGHSATATGGGFDFKAGAGATSTGGSFTFTAGTGSQGPGNFRFLNGKVGIGITGNPTATLDVGGSFNVTGNVQVTGTLNVSGSKSFKIDHPLDPANKYLFHSCVESNDQMNLYNGNVTLDGKGEAVIGLPNWFEALNKDFRYQLTCIGGFAQVYIAEKVSNNRFKIAGGSPGLEVSWQVTGIRNDAYTNAHRMQIEVEKPVGERGKYLHPVENGAPESMGIDYDRNETQRRLDR